MTTSAHKWTRMESVCLVVLEQPGILQIRAAEAMPEPAPNNALRAIAMAKKLGWLRHGSCEDVGCSPPHLNHRHLFATPLGRERLRELIAEVDK